MGLTYRKFNYLEVADCFREQGCELITQEIDYKTTTQLLCIKCKCNEIFTTSFDGFKKKKYKMCSNCKNEIEKDESYKQAKEYIEKTSDSGCKLLTERVNYIGCKKKLEILCPCNEVYSCSISQFKTQNKRTCNKCSIERVRRLHAYTIEDVIKIIENTDTGNGCKYISGQYENNTSELLIQCKCGNNFITTLAKFGHANKKQCDECGFGKKGWKYTYEAASNLISEHGCKLLTQEKEYIDSSQKLKIECNCGNTFEKALSVFKHRNGGRCKDCYLNYLSERSIYSYEYVKKYIEIDSLSKCKLLTSEEEYINTRLPVLFQCECDEIFTTSVHEFKSGNQRRCKKCSKSISKGEQSVKECLENINVNFEMQHSFNDCRHKNPLPFDFSILNADGSVLCLIEYDGELHYKAVEQFGGESQLETTQFRDSIKTQYCIDNNIPLLRIPYWDFERVETIIENKLFELNIS